MIRSIAISAILVMQPLAAQIVKADHCVHQSGDNPDWARPGFDDRQWSSQFPAIGSPYVWTRYTLDLKSLPRTGPIEIGVDSLVPWELFVDGEPAGSFGDIHSGFASTMSQQHRPLPAAAVGHETLVVALRLLPGRTRRSPNPPAVTAGVRDSLLLDYSERVAASWRQQWPSRLGDTCNIVIGIALLFLFMFSGGAGQQQRELLWIGLLSLFYGIEGLQVSSSTLLDYPYGIFLLLNRLADAVTTWAGPRIFFSLVGRPLPPFFLLITAATIAMDLGMTTMILLAPLDVAQSVAAWDLSQIIALMAAPWCLAPLVAFWPLRQIPNQLRLFCGLSLVWSVGNLAIVAPQLPILREVDGFRVAGSNFYGISAIPVLLGMVVVIAQRHRQVALERAELQGEMKSAQEVQRLLTSSTVDAAPWAAVEVAYLPAKEVGGDFYFCRQTTEGQLIAVGDVSGKGLRAAMLASVALGALRHSETSSPGRLLQGLNRSLQGQTGGGFVTCCAALLRNDGRLVVANAGHPPPYVGGREFAVESGLPLGIVADGAYGETSSIGEESITLVSDGVVEAENAQRELFGFDRTREISMKSASEIAEAARAWGQNDDITVVTVVRRMG